MVKKKKFSRYTALMIVVLMLFSILISRLSYLQIVKAEEFRELANNKSVRQIPEPAPRGKIFDKNGTVLATNIQSYMLVYMETDESRKEFLKTFKEVFRLLEESTRTNEDGTVEKEKINDDFDLKVNPYEFKFKSDDPAVRRAYEIRFKKDRGFQDKIIYKYYKGKAENDLTEEEKAFVDEELMKITPEEVFYKLVMDYELYKLLGLSEEEEKALRNSKTSAEIVNLLTEKFPIEEVRKYMLVKDAVKMQSFTGYKPVNIATNIDRKTAFLFEQVKNALPGIDISMQPLRYYPFNELGSSFLGYISKVNSSRQEEYEQRGYDVSSDYIGTAGLESTFEDRLKGVKGGTTVKVNKYGRKTEELFRLDPYPGQDMGLTIDKNLQAVAEKALAETMKDLQINYTHGTDPVNTKNATRGAAIVLDVNTGGVLAMASNPGYDPNLFAVPGKLTSELYKQYFAPDLSAFGNEYIKNSGLTNRKDPNGNNINLDYLFPKDTNIKSAEIRKDPYDIYPKPFYNYATSSLIPPGSTFKPLTAVAGLEEGVITSTERINDAGVFDDHPPVTNNYTGACWIWNEHRGSHGAIDVKTALEVSCNYFFYETSYRLFMKSGLDSLANYAWKFGLGYNPKANAKKTTGLEIAEQFGNVYNEQEYKDIVAFYAIYDVVDMLKAGKDSRGARFTPIDITKYDDDKENIRDLKAKIKDVIKVEIKKDKYEYGEVDKFANILKSMFTELIGYYPEEVQNKISKQDISTASVAVSQLAINDKHTEATAAGQVFNASIGQGANMFTPVQLASYIATLVNGGNRYKVHLVDKFMDASGKVVEQFKPETVEKIDLKQYTIDTVKEGMRKVTSETGTTSGVFLDFPIQTGGKTGSATFKENGVQEAIGRTSYGLYLGFAPYDKPQIAVCVVIFDGGHGGYVAPVARAIYETYFRDELKNIPNFQPMYNYTMNP
jgi:penicillin-binding protein 2